MRKLLPVAVIATLMIACKKEKNPNDVNSTDKSFLIETYSAAKAEIKAGQLAMQKGNSPAVQNFGQRIINSYTSVQADIIDVANKLAIALNDTTTIGAQSLLNLNEINGHSFDTAYMQRSAKSNLNTLGVFQNEMNNGNNTYVRYYFLNKYVDMVKAYYQEADSLSRTL
jgi:putative membrane protein